MAAYEEQFQHQLGALRSVVEQVVPRFLDCGNPMNGFARIRCPDCGHERLLAFSCKCRGFCPSCQARRAAYRTVQRYLEGLGGTEAIPGMIVARQTFGAGALKHSLWGDFNRVDVAEVEAVASGRTGGRIER